MIFRLVWCKISFKIEVSKILTLKLNSILNLNFALEGNKSREWNKFRLHFLNEFFFLGPFPKWVGSLSLMNLMPKIFSLKS